jgi:hypothetical protein
MSGNSLGAGGNFASQFQQNASNAQSADKSFLQRNIRQEKQVVEKQNIQERTETTQADSFSDKKLEENFFKEKIAGNLDLRKQITEQQKNKTQQSSIHPDANPQEQQRIASFIPRVRQLTQKQNLDETQKNEEEEENPHTSISSDLATDQNLNKNISQSDQALEKYRAFHKSGQPESGKTSRVKALIAQKKEESQQKTLNNLYYINELGLTLEQCDANPDSVSWQGFPQYSEFDFIRSDYNVSGYTQPPNNHINFVSRSASTYNWNFLPFRVV